MSDGNEIVGHKTFRDGHGGFRHEPLTKREADSIWESSERHRKERAERLPDEQSAIKAMFDAFDRLRELGWREAIYCPKDGSSFDVIEPGSTGIHRCHYSGTWPTGSWWVADDGDLWPSHPILFRAPPPAAPPSPSHGGQADRRYK